MLDSTYEVFEIYKKYIKQTKGIFVQEIENGDILKAIKELENKVSPLYNTNEFYTEYGYFVNAMKLAKAVLEDKISEYDILYKDIDFSKELGGLKK